jgi:hypothetical protein
MPIFYVLENVSAFASKNVKLGLDVRIGWMCAPCMQLRRTTACAADKIETLAFISIIVIKP